jgi:cell shape-determining protein MreC
MFCLRFKHVFVGLMSASAITAFAVPSRYVTARVPSVEILFAPVARSAGALAGWAHRRLAPELSADQRAAETVKRENEALKDEIASLSVRFTELQQLEDTRGKVGVGMRELCTPYAVIGSDTGTRSSLAIQGSSLQGLRENMVALYSGGIVGRVQRAGVGGTRVQLITDLNFRVLGSFARVAGPKYFRLDHPPTVVEGTGRGAMVIRSLTREDVKNAGLKLGDRVILHDASDWPKNLQGRTLGEIKAIGIRADAPLWASITVEPTQNLMRLKEVMIVTKE